MQFYLGSYDVAVTSPLASRNTARGPAAHADTHQYLSHTYRDLYTRKHSWLSSYRVTSEFDRIIPCRIFSLALDNNAKLFLSESVVIGNARALWLIFSARQHIPVACSARYRPSSCPSVCLSITRVNHTKTVEVRL